MRENRELVRRTRKSYALLANHSQSIRKSSADHAQYMNPQQSKPQLQLPDPTPPPAARRVVRQHAELQKRFPGAGVDRMTLRSTPQIKI